MTKTEKASLPLFSVHPIDIANLMSSHCPGCGERRLEFRNTDIKNKLVLNCGCCGDRALFDVLPD
jgi:hypothetical protein